MRTAASDSRYFFSLPASLLLLLFSCILLRTSNPIPPSQSPTTSYEHIKVSVRQWAEQRHCVSPSLHQPTRQAHTQKLHIRFSALCHAIRFFLRHSSFPPFSCSWPLSSASLDRFGFLDSAWLFPTLHLQPPSNSLCRQAPACGSACPAVAHITTTSPLSFVRDGSSSNRAIRHVASRTNRRCSP